MRNTNNECKYLDSLENILKYGKKRDDRTGTGTISIFGTQEEYDISSSFPLLTTKKMYWNTVVHELLWFLRGDTNIKYLKDNGVNIWDAWADEKGEIGKLYGKQWRNWNGIDQIKNVIESIKNKPYSRRHVVSTWNVSELDEMSLNPCHTLFQFYVNGDRLSCKLYMRSNDTFLGKPYNIACYSLLTYMIAQICNLKPNKYIHSVGDAHIYLNHLDAVNTQISRPILNFEPTIELNPDITNIDDFRFEDIKLINYIHQPAIKAPISI